MTTAKVDDLVFRDDINCRVTDRAAGIEPLAASIFAHGLLNPIGVRPIDGGKYEVVDGNRRAIAIKLLRERGQWPQEVEIIDLGSMTDSDAREISLAANIIREDIHPIDEYEAFAKLAATMKVAEIAEHFGKTEKGVRQRLALGNLHPELRALWRAGKLGDDTVKAFTLCPEQAAQIETYSKLTQANPHGIWGSHVRAALGIDHDANSALNVVGREAYEAAGGTVTEDLFGDDAVMSDPALAKRLLGEKLAAVCAELVASGWGWARPKAEIQNPWGWPKLDPSGKRQPTAEEADEIKSLDAEISKLEALEEEDEGLSEEQDEELDAARARRAKIEDAITLRRWGPRQKKQAGCFVYVDGGEIAIDYGRVDPKAKSKADKATKGSKGSEGEGDVAPAAGEPEKISVALNLALTEQLTKAAYDVISKSPSLALAIAVAALEAAYGRCPAKIRSDGAPCVAHPPRGDASEFHELFEELLSTPIYIIEQRLAVAVAQSLDFRNHNGGGQGEDEIALLRALPARDLESACLKHFDAEHYFKGVNAALCNAALDEMGFAMAGGRPKKKAELAEMCAKAAKEQGWLPPQMRVPSERTEGDA
jgi:ParB family chromosome partitioning protein